MTVIGAEEFENALALVYAEGGSPDYVAGKCPHCGAPFEYSMGDLLQGHFPSSCQGGISEDSK